MIKHFLLSKNFWVLNKQLVKELGIEPTFLLSVFADADETLSDKDGWFYQTVDTIEKLTTLNRYKQDLAIDILIEKGVLEKTHKGMPRKRYFRIDSEGLASLFVEGQQTSQSKVSELVGRSSATSKEHSNKELNNKEVNKDIIPFKDIIDYLNEVSGRQFRNVESNKRLIRARWNEGYKLNDFKKVIDIKYEEWKGTDFEQYVQPSTLFGTKFDQYLNQEVINVRKDYIDDRFKPKD